MPDHPISIRKHPARVILRAGGRVVADTREALALHEAALPVVLYIPREDVNMALLERSSHSTYCPYKGDANYYSLLASGVRLDNVAWTYEKPFALVAQIEGHLSFYPDRVEQMIEEPLSGSPISRLSTPVAR